MSIAAVVLAAGASSRLGEPKQLVMLCGETLLERAVRVAREAECSPVIVVVGAEYEQVVGNSVLGDAVPVINDQWKEGMASSIRLGVRTLRSVGKEAEGVLLMTCDQPGVTVKHLGRLMARAEVTASRYAGKNGVPAFFPKQYFGHLMELKGDVGARELLAHARYEELENGDLDVDTVADLERARELFG
jgi:CTP:molybdopterin cytidylyltransferase MocA